MTVLPLSSANQLPELVTHDVLPVVENISSLSIATKPQLISTPLMTGESLQRSCEQEEQSTDDRAEPTPSQQNRLHEVDISSRHSLIKSAPPQQPFKAFKTMLAEDCTAELFESTIYAQRVPVVFKSKFKWYGAARKTS